MIVTFGGAGNTRAGAQMARILLSAPDVGDVERAMLLEAFDSGWIAPLGPMVDAFEQDLAARVGLAHCAALSAGTAALHLALILCDVKSGDRVYCSTLTFSASANAITYTGARPVFIDSERDSWNMDPALLAQALDDDAKKNQLPKAVVVVDLYGQCADYDPIVAACARYDVPVVEDAAEALGASYKGRPAGSLGRFGVLSFNGNKIISSAGGGALLSDDEDDIKRARFLATQARDPAPHYQHSVVGYNYRLSNLLAAVGRAQLQGLDGKVAKRRAIKQRYREAFADLSGLSLMPDANFGQAHDENSSQPNNWLSCLTLEPEKFGASAEALRLHLDSLDIEARPVWKPMHLQPVFADCEIIGGAVSEDLFARGLCLPSGSAMPVTDQQRVIDAVVEFAAHV